MIYHGRMYDRIKNYDRISPLLHNLHWLLVPERNKFCLGVLVFRFRNNTVPAYLSNDLQWATEDDTRWRLRSASSQADSASFPSYNGRWSWLRRCCPPPVEQSLYWSHLSIIFGTFQETFANPSIPAIIRITFTNFVTCPWSISLTSG